MTGCYRGWVCLAHFCWRSRWSLSGSWQLSWPQTSGWMGLGYSLQTPKLHGSLKASAAHSKLPPSTLPSSTAWKVIILATNRRVTFINELTVHFNWSYLHLQQTNFPLRFHCEAQKLIYADNWHVILRDMFTY